MIPISALNLLLTVFALSAVRYAAWFYFDVSVGTLELWSVLGVGVTFSFLYQFVSPQAKAWLTSLMQGVLFRPATTYITAVVLLAILLIMSSVCVVDVKWHDSGDITPDVTGPWMQDHEVINETDGLRSRRVYAWPMKSVSVDLGAFSQIVRPIPFAKREVLVPMHVIYQEDKDIQDIESILQSAFLQFFEKRFLLKAEREINLLMNSRPEIRGPLARLDAIRQLLALTILGPDAASSAPVLLRQFEMEYPNDPWLGLLEAAVAYSKREYRHGYERIGKAEASSKFPTESARLFFRGVLCLRNARDTDRPDQHDRLSTAISHFDAAYEAALKEEVGDGVYRGLALSSAKYFHGITEFYRHDLEAALIRFEETAAIANGDILARAWNGIGYVHFITGDLEAAEIALLKSLEASPSFAYARSNYGYILLAQDKLAQAIEVFVQNRDDVLLQTQSYRDVVLAKLAIALANESIVDDPSAAISEYSAVLREQKLRDFIGVDPPKLRLAFIYNEVAESIYLDRNYYGLEVFSLLYFARAALMLDSIDESDGRANMLAERIEASFVRVRGSVGKAWIKDTTPSRVFLPISQYDRTLSYTRP